MSGHELRPVRPDEVDAHLEATVDAFYDELHPDTRVLWARECEPERTLDVFAAGEIVATSGLLTRELTVPGATVPMAGVTSVGVRADHRRQGLLDRMMRGQLEAVHERGVETVAALWASEAVIYGRYGFGLAARAADLTVRSPQARVRGLPGCELPPPRLTDPGAVAHELAAVHDAIRPTRPGMLARGEGEWGLRLADLEHERAGRGPLRATLVDGGYALFAVRTARTDEGLPAGVVDVRELLAATPAAAAALWSFLLGLELTRSVRWQLAPSDEPLPHLLTDARAVSARIADSLWLRLVDVARALAERTYAGPLDVVLDVADDVCPDNARRLRLAGDRTGATCEPTAAAPDLSLTVAELGAVHLGGTPLGVLAAAGRVDEHTPGAVAAADTAFRGAREPWCPESF